MFTFCLFICLGEDANDCEFKKKVNDGISLYMRSTIYCFEIVLVIDVDHAVIIMPFCFSALLPHYDFPLDGIKNKENVYQREKIKY